MKQVLILVEGQTEEHFVNRVLQPYLLQFDVFVIPVIVNTKVVKGGNNFKGGLSHYGNVRKHLEMLLADKSIFVTTLFDFYQLPSDFPGCSSLVGVHPNEKVQRIELALYREFENPRFIPYIQLHEYEAMLFSSDHGFQKFFGSRIRVISDLQKIMEDYPNPELINERPSLAPSKRILSLIPDYNKVIHGQLIASAIGIELIRAKCSHFSGWIDVLTNLP